MNIDQLKDDFICAVASEPASQKNIERWQHEAQKLCNAIYRESNPCPVFMCSHCAEEWAEEAQRARDEQFAAMEYSRA